MDWHKLQHKLFAMDPVDPRAELENLRKIAQTPTPLEEPDLLNESYAIKPGSMPLGIDSISDFAALAGIRIDEKQLKGPAGQAKGSDPMPAKKFGREDHPLKNKLVGEVSAADALSHGFNNYNSMNALAPGSYSSSSYGGSSGTAGENPKLDMSVNVEHLARLLSVKDIQRFSAAVVSASQGNPIASADKQLLGEAFQHMLLLQESKKKEVFRAIVGLAPRQASKPTATNKIKTPNPSSPGVKTTRAPNAANTQQAAATPSSNTTTPTQQNSSKLFSNSKQTIKEHLLKLLEEKKLK